MEVCQHSLFFFHHGLDLDHKLLLLFYEGVQLHFQFLVRPLKFLLSLVLIFHLPLSLHQGIIKLLILILNDLIPLEYLLLLLLNPLKLALQRLIAISLLKKLFLSLVELRHFRLKVVDDQSVPVVQAVHQRLQVSEHCF